MEPLQNNQPNPAPPISTPSITPVTTEVLVEDKESLNIYPIIRHLFLMLCILLTITIILFLFYQNGKSIYDKGL